MLNRKGTGLKSKKTDRILLYSISVKRKFTSHCLGGKEDCVSILELTLRHCYVWQGSSLMSQNIKPDAETAAAAAKSLHSCPTLCYPMDSSPPGSSVHRILQARILEWVAVSFSPDEMDWFPFWFKNWTPYMQGKKRLKEWPLQCPGGTVYSQRCWVTLEIEWLC